MSSQKKGEISQRKKVGQVSLKEKKEKPSDENTPGEVRVILAAGEK